MNNFLISIDHDESTKFQDSIQALLTDDATSVEQSLLYLLKCKINFNRLEPAVQTLFIETFDKLIKRSTNESLLESITALNRYLDVFNNNSYDTPIVRRRLKQETCICEVAFSILNKILVEDSSKEIECVTGLLINVIELLSKSFQDYNADWKEYNAIMVILRIATKEDKFAFRMRCLNIIRNIYDYVESSEDVDEYSFEVDKYETQDERIQKRKLSIDYIIKSSSTGVAALVRSKSFLKAIRYLAVNVEHEKFEAIHGDDEKTRLVSLLVEFMHFNYTYVFEAIARVKRAEILTFTNEEQAQLLKRISFINYINLFIISYYSQKSHEFCLIFADKTDGVDFIFQVLQNDIFHDVIEKYKTDLIYTAYTRTIATTVAVLNNIKYTYNQFPKAWRLYGNSNLFTLSKTLLKFNVNAQILFNTIPFFCKYADDGDDQAEIKDFNEAFKLYIESEDLFNSRRVLNAISKYFPNAVNLQKQSIQSIKQFLRISINFIKKGHSMLSTDLKALNTATDEYQDVIERLLKVSYFLRQILTSLQNVADKSIEFCIMFHENPTENGVKVLLDFANDSTIMQIILKNLNNPIIHSIAVLSYRAVFGTIHNVSKAAYKFRDMWVPLDAFSVLLSLGNKTNTIDSYFQLVSFMTIGNIASEEDLNNFSSSLSILETIMKKVKEFSNALSDKNGKVFRDEFKIDETDVQKYQIISIKGWNYFEMMQAVYHFSVNDNIKGLIYDTLKMKDYLRVFLYNGNEIEQEFALKVLHQLCFDKKIAQDVIRDVELVAFMNNKLSCCNESTRRGYIKSLEGILWIANEIHRNESERTSNLKHIFISYNSECRSLCLSIKSRLEAFGFKVWIDVEQMRGSTLESMANAIESSSFVLICMTEKYKESANCRFEAEYVVQLKKSFIPLIMQSSYRPGGWLGLILGTRMYIDFTKYDFEECMSRLKRELEAHKADTTPPLPPPSVDQIDSSSAIITESTTVFDLKKSVYQWTELDVENWLTYKKISLSIRQNIVPCDGRVLEQLYKISQEVPEFFYSSLRTDTKANLKEIASFTSELRSLFTRN